MPRLSISYSTGSYKSEDEEIYAKKRSVVCLRLRIGLIVLSVTTALVLFGVVIPVLFEILYVKSTVDKYIGVCSINPRFMVECFPGVEVNADRCRQRDCCWTERNDDLIDVISTPKCYHRLPSSYRLMVYDDEFDIFANVTNQIYDLSFPLQLRTYKSTVSENWIRTNQLNSTILLSVSESTESRLLLRFSTNLNDTLEPMNYAVDPLYDIRAVFSDNGCVDIFVIRRDTESRIFSLNCVGSLIVNENYTEMTILLPQNSSFYGMGFVRKDRLERPFFGEEWTLLSNMSNFDKDSSLYGAHAQYLCVEQDGKAHGVVFDTGRVLHVSLLPVPALVIRMAGPIVDIHIALGPTPVEVVSQLSDIPGVSERPSLPPFWALGYHLCPMGKVDFRDQMSKLRNRSIPLASHCVNSELYQNLVFENDDKLSEIRDLQRTLLEMKQDGTKLVGIAFPHVALVKGNTGNFTKAFETGVEKKIFLSSRFGKFWDDISVAFLDPTNPDTPKWMSELLSNISKKHKIEFDAFVLHWNTPLDLRNFTAQPCSNDTTPSLLSEFENVTKFTLCPEIAYNNGQTHKQFVNKYGLSHTKLMSKVFEMQKSRPFVVSLSSSTGIGHWGGVWGGMYYSTWESLQESLNFVQESSIYGIPLSGIPICGHLGLAENELCGRWFQLGAFYPLALSFYDADEGERNPLMFNEAFTFFVRSALKLRYSLLPYLYSLFYDAHTTGNPVLRPLFFEFPQFPLTRNQKNAFLWGAGLLFLPCTEKRKDSVVVWLPNVEWYEFYSGRTIEMAENSTGQFVTLPTPMYYINIFIRGGYVIFTQMPNTTIADTRASLYRIYVALNRETKECSGYLFIDDGESIGGPEIHVRVKCVNDSLLFNVRKEIGALEYLERKRIATSAKSIRIYGIDDVGIVKVDGRPLNSKPLLGQSAFINGVLEIYYKLKFDTNHNITWTN